MGRAARHEIGPDQGTLFAPMVKKGQTPHLTPVEAFNPEPAAESTDLDIRSDKLIKALGLLGRMSRASAFNKAQHNPQVLQNMYDTVGVDGVGKTNTFVDRAREKWPEQLRTLFTEATGYSPQDPKDKDYDPKSDDNRVFREFEAKYKGSENQKNREKLKRTLVSQRKKLGFKPIKTQFRKKPKRATKKAA